MFGAPLLDLDAGLDLRDRAFLPGLRGLDLGVAFGVRGTDRGLTLDPGDPALTEGFEIAVVVADPDDLENVDFHADAGQVASSLDVTDVDAGIRGQGGRFRGDGTGPDRLLSVSVNAI